MHLSPLSGESIELYIVIRQQLKAEYCRPKISHHYSTKQ